jgi:hypothetical protein
MKTAQRASASDDLHLWSTAIAGLAILLQTLLVGFVGSADAMAATMDHSAIGHSAPGPTHDHHQSALASLFCCVCSAGVAAVDAPAIPPALLPRLAVSLAAPRGRHSASRRKLIRPGAQSARGPPRRA